MKLTPPLAALCASFLVFHLGSRAAVAQTQLPPEPLCYQILGWVDPAGGDDATGAINDDFQPFKTLQAAIYAVQIAVASVYDYYDNPDGYGLVIALPGLYGPHGPGSSGDVFPIMMRDRVDVRGFAANRCIIRGAGAANKNVFWPDAATVGSVRFSELLVDFIDSNECNTLPDINATASPWCTFSQTGVAADHPDRLSGFTFQGGDVQVVFHRTDLQASHNLTGIISDCVFDMRNRTELPGPWFGLMMVKRHLSHDNNIEAGYLGQEVLIAHNTFILAEYDTDLSAWVNRSRPEAVGLIDVTNPRCVGGGGGAVSDCDTDLRGVGRHMLVGNLFRVGPGDPAPSPQPFAMLGIEAADTRVLDGGSYVQTNAFAWNRVGASNGHFYSTPQPTVPTGMTNSGPVYDCRSNPLVNQTVNCTPCNPGPAPCPGAPFPAPAINLWDGDAPAGGVTEVDPAFVGEYLGTVDWRLLPGSPLQDLALARMPDNNLDPVLTSAAGVTFTVPPCPGPLFKWDGEGHGNIPKVGERRDIGFDEVHALIVANSHGADSRSHNEPGGLNPLAPQGNTNRVFILPRDFDGQLGFNLDLNGTELLVGTFPDRPAPSRPKRTLAQPVVDSTLPPDHQTRYINLTNPSPTPTPWSWSPLPGLTIYDPPGRSMTSQAQLSFVRGSRTDYECTQSPCTSHFNLQGVISRHPGGSANTYWTNLQSEYR